jgi:hypothetical protein
MVERIENPEMYEKYCERRKKLMRSLDRGDNFRLVENLPRSSGPLKTNVVLQKTQFLRSNVESKVC